MAKHNEYDNVMLVESVGQIDQVNSSFYNRFPFPWRPANFYAPLDPDLYTQLFNQNIGAYHERVVPAEADIWVAGCGTNQGIYTALRFPQACIVGSDLSAHSLSICSETARNLKVNNLTLHQESINQADYVECFDYIICTGVIHHNADPAQTLARLTRALKPSGVLELMVYNRYHRLLHQAFQRSIRLFSSAEPADSRNEFELKAAYRFAHSFMEKNLMYGFLQEQLDMPEEQVADNLIQPVEYSYTVESLSELATVCGLELLLPCPNEYDASKGTLLWHVEFTERELQHEFDSFPDLKRWQISNLLLLERSPMLWFYLQRRDGGRSRRSEALVNEAFLEEKFQPLRASQNCYLRQPSGIYSLSSTNIPLPNGEPHASLAAIFERADGKTSMRDIFRASGVEMNLRNISNARVHMASSMFPYLTS